MKLYLKFLSINLRSQMQYKGSFFLLLASQFLIAFSGCLAIYFMFTRFNTVEGFTFPQVLLCFSAVNIAFSLAEVFARGFDAFSTMIGNGEFDRIMLRPKNTVFMVLASKMDFSRLGKLVQGVVIILVAIPLNDINWTWDKIVTYLLMIIMGAVTFFGLFLIYAALCFFTTEGLEVINIFTDGTREFGQYPVSIYGDGVLKFLTFVVPVALFQYYPFLYILDRESSALYMISPLFSLIFLIPCYAMWRIGLKKYKSTGS